VDYLKLFDFSHNDFDDALRQFLSKFTLPREAQMIDRVMEKFSQRFHECQPSRFANADVAYILAFSLIMLNTDAHNDNIKPENKMSKIEFVKNNRGINEGGKDLPK
jgi:brefeldin A-inhibited guanine nucleotide-exchange protein